MGLPRTGYTLLEVLVVTVVMAIGLGVVTGALVGEPDRGETPDPWLARLDSARSEAARTGRAIVVRPNDTTGLPVLFLPDGRSVSSFESVSEVGS